MAEWTLILVFSMTLLFALAFFGVPIALSLFVVAFLTIFLFEGLDLAIAGIGPVLFGGTSSFSLVCLPLFIFMAYLLIGCGTSAKAYESLALLFGGFKAGLLLATNAMLAFLGALLGSSAASIGMAMSMGAPELQARGYRNSTIAGLIASAGGLAVVIPPSILMVLYAFVMEQPIIPLFVAGAVPGLILALSYAVWIVVAVPSERKNVDLGAPANHPRSAAHVSVPAGAAARIEDGGGLTGDDDGGAVESPVSETPSWIVRPHQVHRLSTAEASLGLAHKSIAIFVGLVPILFIAATMLGAMITGVASVNEAAAIGVLSVVIVAILQRSLTVQAVTWAAWHSVQSTGFILFLILGAKYFGFLFTLTGVTQQFTVWMTDSPLSGAGLLLVMMAAFLLLGCVMETTTLMLVLVPVAATALVGAGYDPIFLGVLFAINLELGMLTPPVGMNLFITAGAGRPYGITFNDVVRGVLPYCLINAVFLGVLVYQPEIALWLPGVLGY